jgi:hypothetical protein
MPLTPPFHLVLVSDKNPHHPSYAVLSCWAWGVGFSRMVFVHRLFFYPDVLYYFRAYINFPTVSRLVSFIFGGLYLEARVF